MELENSQVLFRNYEDEVNLKVFLDYRDVGIDLTLQKKRKKIPFWFDICPKQMIVIGYVPIGFGFGIHWMLFY